MDEILEDEIAIPAPSLEPNAEIQAEIQRQTAQVTPFERAFKNLLRLSMPLPSPDRVAGFPIAFLAAAWNDSRLVTQFNMAYQGTMGRPRLGGAINTLAATHGAMDDRMTFLLPRLPTERYLEHPRIFGENPDAGRVQDYCRRMRIFCDTVVEIRNDAAVAGADGAPDPKFGWMVALDIPTEYAAQCVANDDTVSLFYSVGAEVREGKLAVVGSVPSFAQGASPFPLLPFIYHTLRMP
jgi:hypothetical protein